MAQLFSNSGDPDLMQLSVASDLGLQYSALFANYSFGGLQTKKEIV